MFLVNCSYWEKLFDFILWVYIGWIRIRLRVTGSTGYLYRWFWVALNKKFYPLRRTATLPSGVPTTSSTARPWGRWGRWGLSSRRSWKTRRLSSSGQQTNIFGYVQGRVSEPACFGAAPAPGERENNVGIFLTDYELSKIRSNTCTSTYSS